MDTDYSKVKVFDFEDKKFYTLQQQMIVNKILKNCLYNLFSKIVTAELLSTNRKSLLVISYSAIKAF